MDHQFNLKHQPDPPLQQQQQQQQASPSNSGSDVKIEKVKDDQESDKASEPSLISAEQEQPQHLRENGVVEQQPSEGFV